VNSVATRSAQGPVRPKGVSAVTVASGAASRTSCRPIGNPGSHTTASACDAMVSTASTDDASVRFRRTRSTPPDSHAHSEPVSPGSAVPRHASPSGMLALDFHPKHLHTRPHQQVGAVSACKRRREIHHRTPIAGRLHPAPPPEAVCAAGPSRASRRPWGASCRKNGRAAGPEGPAALAKNNQMARTFWASSPLRPLATSNSTF
jgi:hypothetical protein